MALDPRRVKALFQSALDLSSLADRPAFLERECGDDPELRHRLEALLVAHDKPAPALEQPLAVDPSEPDQTQATTDGPTVGFDRTETLRPEITPPASILGTVIAGRYKVREEIGEGGMGSVYLAEQTQPVKRRVALKLIKAGMDRRPSSLGSSPSVRRSP